MDDYFIEKNEEKLKKAFNAVLSVEDSKDNYEVLQ